MPVRTLKAKGGSVGTRGPWEPGRTGLTLTPQHEWMLKWLEDEGFKIKV
jgi:nitrate reductase alpha subunit